MFLVSTDNLAVAMAVEHNDNAWGARRFWIDASVVVPLALCFVYWRAAPFALALLLIKVYFSHKALVESREDLMRVVEQHEKMVGNG